MKIGEMIEELEGTLVDVISYDTWGDAEDGYWVNDSRKMKEEVPLDIELFQHCFGAVNAFEVDESADFGDDVYEIIEKETGEPVGRIEVSVL